MIKRNPAKITQVQTRQPRRWPTYSLILVCGLLLVSGFFFAGRQHFSSMDYGMKNSRLRKQIDDLEAEKRRLLLNREISLSPAEIKKAAKKAGFIDAAEPVPELAKMAVPITAPIAAPTKEKAITPVVATVRPKTMIVKTASIAAAPASVPATYSRTERIVKPVKRTTAAE